MKNLYFILIAVLVSFSSRGQILGTPSVCVGSTTPLSDPGATSWVSTNTSIATVGSSSGIVTGVSAGVVTIYDSGPLGYTATVNVTVSSLPDGIFGPLAICSGYSTTLGDTTVGGTWSVGITGIATITSATGIATGVVAGTTPVTYTLSTGCFATAVLTINPNPPMLTITPDPICVGGTATLSDAAGIGSWTSSNPTVAAVSGSGVLTGISAGYSYITYSLPTGCVAFTVATVNASAGTILGVPIVCVGGTTLLTDVAVGGTWSDATPAIASIGMATGIVTGISAGTVVVSYTVPTGCWSTVVVTVNPLPGPFTGPGTLCVGGTDTVTGFSPPGYWSGGATLDTTLGTGVISGTAPGISTITYTSIGTTCSSTMIVTVVSTVGSISGPSSMCDGLSITLSDPTAGGTWASSTATVAPIGSASGIATGVSPGTTTISYIIAGGCLSSMVVTVNPLPAIISGPTSVCATGSVTLTDATAGGTWISSLPAVATVDPATGVVTGVATGTATVSYELATTCATSLVVTVVPTPAAPVVSGTSFYCPCVTFAPFTVVPSSGILWYAAATGGTGSATAPVVNTCVPAVTTNWASQTVAGCESSRASFTVTVDAAPVVTAASSTNCGGTFTLTGGGAGTGGSYIWSPSTGLSCAGCGTSTATISATTTYTVTGADAGGCTGTNTVTLNADRISGFVSLAATATDTVKVWLIQFNSTDSSIIAQDSTLSCMDSGTPYYEFDSKPAGNYMVKAKLLSSVPGTTGYVPTYGLSSSVWDSAATLTHVISATDTQHINMIYGIVPPGPGFIGGLISGGAGRGTAGGTPVAGMLVYLKNATTNAIITYTYTDGTGAYSFSGIANGSYTIYPVDYKYHTIPWIDVTLSTSSETASAVSFYEHTGNHTITPYPTPVPVCCGLMTSQIGVFPDPAGNELNIFWGDEPTGNASVIITDLVGHEINNSVLNMSSHSGTAKLDLSPINNGIYVITIKAPGINYTNKLVIQH